jgi:adenylosuccinate lyase
MIARYQRPEMEKIWSEESKFSSWFEVECGVIETLGDRGIIPTKSAKTLLKNAGKIIFDAKAVKAIERLDGELKHDVLAFTTFCAEHLGAESRYFHFGLTSTDVVDTALALRVREAGELVKTEIHGLLKVLKKRAIEFKGLPCLGRTHGMAAEPTMFGLKFLGWFTEMERNFLRVDRALKELEFGKISGAVGASAHFSPVVESDILKKFGLKREPVSTQVLPRDRLANLFFQLALCGTALERMAVEFRHLQRSEVGEVFEGFSAKQKGSSAMPHKRNPISSENLVGISRLLRSYVHPALENVVLWHERDISHSSVERVILADAFSLIHYALARMSGIVANLEVNEVRVAENLTTQGSHVYSGHLLLELVHRGALREDAYRWIQAGSFRAKERKVDPIQEWKRHADILRFISVKKMEEVVSPKKATQHVGLIYEKVLKASLV